MDRTVPLVVLAVAVVAAAAIGVTAYAQAPTPSGPVFESAELDGDILTISFDKDIELGAADLSKLHIRDRGSSTDGLTLSLGSTTQLDADPEYVLLFEQDTRSGNNPFAKPSDIALDSGDQIIVVEAGNNPASGNVHILGPRGGPQNSFGSITSDNLAYPRSVAVNGSDHIFVADGDSHVVRIFDKGGTLLSTGFGNGTEGNATGQLNKPEAVAVDAAGRVFVADTQNDRVQVFASDDTPVRELPAGDAGLNKPRGIEVGPDGTVYVSDTNNNVIRVLGPDAGGLVRTLNTTDTDAGPLKGPRALAVGPGGNLFVADMNGHRIVMFHPNGTLYDTIGTEGTGGTEGTFDVQFKEPRGVEVGSNGRVYVADTENDRIQVLAQAVTTITLKLDNDALRTVTGLSDPVLDIDRGAVSAATKEGDLIAPSIDNPLVTPDSSPRGLEFEVAVLDGQQRTLSIYFDGEISVNPADFSGLHVRERGERTGGVTLSGGPDIAPGDRFTTVGTLTAPDGVTFDQLSGLTVDSAGRIIVADRSANSTIRIFNPDGTPAGSFMSDSVTGLAESDNGLTDTRDVAVNGTGHIFATDMDNLIQVFRPLPDGRYTHMHNLGTSFAGSDPGQVNNPMGVAVNATGHIFTAEENDNRIQIFRPDSPDAGGHLRFVGGGDNGLHIGMFGNAPNDNKGPVGIATDNAGRIVVTSTETDRVYVLSPHGETRVHDFGGNGRAPGEFIDPQAVATDAYGRIFVADTGNHRIQAFDRNGKFIGMAGATDNAGNPIEGTGALGFKRPSGIAVDNDGRILVSDTGNKRIQVIVFSPYSELTRNPDGDSISGAAVLLQDVGLNGPRGVVVDSNGRIIVTDTSNDRVRIFNQDGTHALDIGENFTKSDDETGTFDEPWGVAVNSTDHIFVANSRNHTIQVFDKTGMHVRELGNGTAGFLDDPLQFSTPTGVAVDGSDNVFVVDNSQIRMLSPGGDHVSTGTASTALGAMYGVAVDGNGRIVVPSDESTAALIVLDNIDHTGAPRIDSSLFDKPRGVATDAHGRMWVADEDSHSIRLFNQDLGLADTFGSEGNGTGQFQDPFGITIDSTDRILVADTGNHRIQEVSVASRDGLLIFELDARTLAGIHDISDPVLYIDAGAVAGPDGGLVPAVQDGKILRDAVAPTINAMTVMPGDGSTVGYGGSLYVIFESEPGLTLQSGSEINGKPVKADMMTYLGGGVYAIEHTVSSNDPDVADTDAIPATITVRDEARNAASVFVDSIPADIAPAIDSGRMTATLEDSSFSTDGSSISLRFSGPVSISDILALQVRDGSGNATVGLLSRDVGLSIPGASPTDYERTYTIGTGSAGFTNMTFNEPSDVAINSTGYMFVADAQNHRVQVFGPDRTPVDSIGNTAADGSPAAGTGPEHFKVPRGIAVDGTDRVLVIEEENWRVQILHPNGSFADAIGAIDRSDGEPNNDGVRGAFESPKDVATDSTGRILVADDGNRRIQIFDPNGKYIVSIPPHNPDTPEEFTDALNSADELFGTGRDVGPEGVTIGDEDRIFAADTDKHRIYTFAHDRSDIFVFGAEGSEPGNFTEPRGMAADDAGRIWVAEGGDNDRLQLIHPNGTHVAFLGEDDGLADPIGVAYDRYRVYVADTNNSRILIYEPPASEFRFTLSGDALAAVQRMGSPYLDVAVGDVITLDGTQIARSYEVRPPVPDDGRDDVTDTRVIVDVAVPSAQDRSLVGSRGGGSSGIIIDNTIVQSTGEATSVLHRVYWETNNDMITLYMVTSTDGSEPDVHLKTPDSGSITAKISDSQPYPGRILYEAEISASNSFAQVYVDGVSEHILLDAPDGDVSVTLYDDSDTSFVEPAREPVTTKPDPVIEPETPTTIEPVEPTMKDDKQDPIDVDEPVRDVVDPELPVDNDQTTDDGGINGCLIATAAYGTELAPQVQLLREIRDGSLLQTHSGTAFMGAFNNIYYAFSPEIADLQRENPVFREATKLLLTPMLYTLNIMSMADDEASVLGLGLSVIALNIGMYVAAPAFAGYTVYKHRKNVWK